MEPQELNPYESPAPLPEAQSNPLIARLRWEVRTLLLYMAATVGVFSYLGAKAIAEQKMPDLLEVMKTTGLVVGPVAIWHVINHMRTRAAYKMGGNKCVRQMLEEKGMHLPDPPEGFAAKVVFMCKIIGPADQCLKETEEIKSENVGDKRAS